MPRSANQFLEGGLLSVGKDCCCCWGMSPKVRLGMKLKSSSMLKTLPALLRHRQLTHCGARGLASDDVI